MKKWIVLFFLPSLIFSHVSAAQTVFDFNWDIGEQSILLNGRSVKISPQHYHATIPVSIEHTSSNDTIEHYINDNLNHIQLSFRSMPTVTSEKYVPYTVHWAEVRNDVRINFTPNISNNQALHFNPKLSSTETHFVFGPLVIQNNTIDVAKIEQLNIQIDYSQHGELTDLSIKGSFAKAYFLAQNKTYGPGFFVLDIRNLSISTLETIKTEFDALKYLTGEELLWAQLHMMQQLPFLLSKGAQLSSHFSVSHSAGDISGDFNLDLTHLLQPRALADSLEYTMQLPMTLLLPLRIQLPIFTVANQSNASGQELLVPLETRGHMNLFAPLTEIVEWIKMLNLL